MFRELHPNIRIRIYTSFLSRVVGSMIFPFMAIYFTKEMNATYAGILLMANVAIQFVASLYGGYLADTLGRKKMMVTGEWIKVFAFSGMVLANSPWWTSPWITFWMLVLLSISEGLIHPAADAMLIDVSTKKTRTFMYSINYWTVNLSIMLGLIIGGWLFQTHLIELLISLFVMSLITLLMTTLLIQDTYQPTTLSKQTAKSYGIMPIIQSYHAVIRDLPFVWFTLGGIAIFSIEYQRNNFIAIRLAEEIPARTFQVIGDMQLTLDGVKLLSLLTVENTIIIVLCTVFISKWVQNKAEQPIMYAGFILFGLGYAVLAFSNNLLALSVAVVVLSIGELLYVPTRQAILADIIVDSQRGAYMAFNGFVFQIGKMIASLSIIVGQAIGGIGMGILYVLLALIGIMFSWLAMQTRLSKNVTSTITQHSIQNN